MYFWPCWLFTAVTALLRLQCNRATLPCGAWALEHRLNSSGTQAQPPHSMCDPPDQGSNPHPLHQSHRGSTLLFYFFVFLRGPGRLHLHNTENFLLY